jgi:hypothetical protein
MLHQFLDILTNLEGQKWRPGFPPEGENAESISSLDIYL